MDICDSLTRTVQEKKRRTQKFMSMHISYLNVESRKRDIERQGSFSPAAAKIAEAKYPKKMGGELCGFYHSTIDSGCQVHLSYNRTLFHKCTLPSWFCYLLLSA